MQAKALPSAVGESNNSGYFRIAGHSVPTTVELYCDDQMRMHDCRLMAVASIIIVAAGLWTQMRGQSTLGAAPPRKSDTFAATENGRSIRVQQGELPASNFQIIGVDLTRDQDVLDQAARILGRVRTTATGDASTFQETACYRSADRDDPTVLLVGKGEVDCSFKLTSSDPLRNQRANCMPSAKISSLLATGSGLRLGDTPDQVIALLGQPTRRSRNTTLGRTVLVYDFETTKITAPRDLAKIREEHPGMSEHDIEANFGSYGLEESIQATFERDSLTDLLVDWSAQY